MIDNSINGNETYIDDYGVEKRLTVTDHSPKSRMFAYNPKRKTKQEQDLIRQGVIAGRNLAFDFIDQDEFKKLFPLYYHIINYDTSSEMYMWDKDKLKIITEDDMCFKYYEEQLNLIRNVGN